MRGRFLIAALSATALVAAPFAATAGEHRGRHHSGSTGYYAGSIASPWNNRYNGWNSDGYGYSAGRYGAYNSYGRWSGDNRYYHNDGYRHRGDNGTALGIGLGVIGLALAVTAMSGSKKKSDDDYRRDDDRYDRDGWYRGESGRQDGRWRNPDDAPVNGDGKETAYSDFDRTDCVQTREYQTKVTVGGRSRDAYGTTCLLPGGQWLQGPARLVPEDSR